MRPVNSRGKCLSETEVCTKGVKPQALPRLHKSVLEHLRTFTIHPGKLELHQLM